VTTLKQEIIASTFFTVLVTFSLSAKLPDKISNNLAAHCFRQILHLASGTIKIVIQIVSRDNINQIQLTSPILSTFSTKGSNFETKVSPVDTKVSLFDTGDCNLWYFRTVLLISKLDYRKDKLSKAG
jgi:hypothetical protein